MKTLRILMPLAWRNIWRNRRRTLITLAVVAVGTASVVLFAALINAWADSSRSRTLNLLTGSGQIHAPGFLDDPGIGRLMPPPTPALIDALNDPAIAVWAPRLPIEAVLQSEYRTMPASVIGVDPARESRLSILPGSVTEGHYLQAGEDDGIVLGITLANRLKTRIGKRVILMALAADGTPAEKGFVVVGLYDSDTATESRYAFVHLDAMQQMLGVGQKIGEIAFLVPDEARLSGVLGKLRASAPGLDIRSWTQLSIMAAAMQSSMHVATLIWLWVMFIMMGFGIVNTQLMAVFERVREFGLLQALGMRPRQVMVLVSLEALILVGIGVIGGALLAVALIRAFSGGIDIAFLGEGAAMAGAGNVLYPKLDPVQIFALPAVLWILGVLVALWPARKAARSSPVEAMRHDS